MKAFRQLGFLKLPLQRAQAAPEDHRVLALFRNRAELKKAFGDLKEEVERLKDRVKQQEGVTRRVRETLGALEQRLGVDETAYPALVFYQLRRLWKSGHDQLERFVGELAAQQEERERRAHLAEHNRRQFARRQSAEQHLHVVRELCAQANQRVATLERERAALRRFWHFFKRRALEQILARARAEAAAAEASFASACQSAAELAAEQAPEFPGLSLQARRLINLTVIAYAEVMCASLTALPLLVMRAREATQHREVIDEYGTRAECLALMHQIQRAETLLGARTRFGREIRARLVHLRRAAQYRAEEDTVPMAESFSDSAEHPSAAAPEGIPNVLAEDTWNIHSVLLG